MSPEQLPLTRPTLASTPQEVFDFVVVGLIRQGKRSLKGDRCKYYIYDYETSQHLKCAVGQCISDEDYITEIEEHNIDYLTVDHPTFKNTPSGQLIKKHERLFTDLQYWHDSELQLDGRKFDSDIARESLNRIAHIHRLSLAHPEIKYAMET